MTRISLSFCLVSSTTAGSKHDLPAEEKTEESQAKRQRLEQKEEECEFIHGGGMKMG